MNIQVHTLSSAACSPSTTSSYSRSSIGSSLAEDTANMTISDFLKSKFTRKSSDLSNTTTDSEQARTGLFRRTGSNRSTSSRSPPPSTAAAAARSTAAALQNAAALRANNPYVNPTSTRRPSPTGPRTTAASISTQPPPPYTPNPEPVSAPAASPAGPAAAPTRTPAPAVKDDKYAFLASFDTMFLIDDSGSMAGRSWRETRLALQAITPICVAQDRDGIDVQFLNHEGVYTNIVDAGMINRIFDSVRPSAATPTGIRLDQILKAYLGRYEADRKTKPLNLIVITDGVPSDDVESPIIDAARKLDQLSAPAWQVGIQFFQVGNEPEAAEALRELDDELADLAKVEGEAKMRDIVDTVPWNGTNGQGLNADGILKVVLGAVNRRLDRKKNSGEWRR